MANNIDDRNKVYPSKHKSNLIDNKRIVDTRKKDVLLVTVLGGNKND